ncbi:MAG: kelch repeat-containing protein [Thermogemmata sp.]
MGRHVSLAGLVAILAVGSYAQEPSISQAPNTWVKRSPLEGTPPSPRLGYEGACVWDSKHHVMIRYGGHNQGGGGEQHSEVWTFDPITARWTLKEPNTSPPGICCGQQNVFDPIRGRYIRFPAFSGSHGWQWFREIYLNDSSVWTYDLETNLWRNMRPLPSPRLAPLRCASWDADEEVVVVFGGEGSREGTLVYDPYTNEWKWMNPKIEPEFRSGGNMAYDSARKLHILFGAQFLDDPHTWAYDLKKNEWRDMKPAVMPPTKQNDAVLAYDPHNKVILAVVKITETREGKSVDRLETWAYDAGANRWTKMNPPQEPDPSGARARQLMFAPELNLAILENRTHPPQGRHEQQIWTYRYADGKPHEPPKPSPRKRTQPPLVEDVTVSVVSAKQVELSWKPVKLPGETDNLEGSAIVGYHVERAVVEVWSEDQLKRLKSSTPPLPEPSVGAIRRIGQFERLTAMPVKGTTFTDTSVDLQTPKVVAAKPIYERRFYPEELEDNGKPYRFAVYAYRIRAVNARGEWSGPSPACFTLPSSPQWVFAKEEGTTCHLKWAANPEKGIQGYRIYRMDGRWQKDPVSRLTAHPISRTTYSDPTAGKAARRYYVVAVDALGQEGFPSAPVWFNRGWRPFYLPFIGEWHQ